VALDPDPTSRYSHKHRLVEIGAVCCRLDGRERTTFQRCIDPEMPKPPDVQQLHGITDRVVQSQPTIGHVLPPFIKSLALPTRFSWPVKHDSTSAAIAERCAITIVYECRLQRPRPRTMTPQLVLEVHGVAYVVAHCYQGGCEKTFRLDCIRECWLD
jgi:WYL domain/Exonuclease